MLNPAHQLHINSIRAKLAAGHSKLENSDKTQQNPHIKSLLNKFDIILDNLKELAENYARPNSIKTYSPIILGSLQRDMERLLKEAHIAEYVTEAECIIGMYSHIYLHETAGETKKHEAV